MAKKKEERKMIDANDILDKIIALTFTRHATATSDEFLTDIGVDLDKSRGEDVETIYSRFALLNRATREIFLANEKVQLINETLKLTLGESENGKQG